MNILITGGAGFIGSHTADILVAKGHRVRILDNLDPQVHPGDTVEERMPAWLNKQAEFVYGDIRSKEAVASAVKDMDAVVHLASKVGVMQSHYQAADYIETNIYGTANILQEAIVNRQDKIRKIVFASSCTTYGEAVYLCNGDRDCIPRTFKALIRTRKDVIDGWDVKCPECGEKTGEVLPLKEETRQDCNSIYGITKKSCEEIIQNICATYEVPFTIFRYFNVYGARQSVSNPYTGVTSIFVSCLQNNIPPIIYEDGRQSRDFVSVYDVAQANARATIEAFAGIYNIGSGVNTSVSGIASIIGEILGKQILSNITGQFRSGDIRHSLADISKAASAFGFVPLVDLRQGLIDLIKWSASQPAKMDLQKVEEELKKNKLVG